MFMAREKSYLELQPEHVLSLIDVFNDMYNHEQPHIELSHFAHIFHQLMDMKQHLHWCEKCNTKYFDHRAGEYRMVCDPCCEEMKEENE